MFLQSDKHFYVSKNRKILYQRQDSPQLSPTLTVSMPPRPGKHSDRTSIVAFVKEITLV